MDCNDFDLNYKLAYKYEQEKSYLKALKIYENLVFSMEDSEQRQQIIEKLNKLEEENKDILQIEMEKQKETRTKSKEGNLNLHLMYDSPYCDEFMHFVNNNFPQDEHKFVVLGEHNQEFQYMHLDKVKNVEVIDLRYDLQKLLNDINMCSKIFIHYLFDYFCELVCRANISKPIYWAFWGGDLYNYIDMELYEPMTKELLKNMGCIIDSKVNKNTIEYLYRKVTIRKLRGILCRDNGEFKNVKKHFLTLANQIPFVYPNPVNCESLQVLHNNANNKYDFKSGFKYAILVGNSANPTNNHLEILNKLKEIKSQDFRIIVPLSYGGFPAYTNKLIDEGKKLFGERFIPITKYFPPEEYYDLLKQVDVGIFNHNRTQGQSTVCMLTILGKKVYVNKNTTLYYYFEKMGIKLSETQQIEDLDVDELAYLNEDIKANNINNTINGFSNKTCLELMKNIFQ